jgi:monomeric isocitrate dehydrogenase
MPNIKGSKDFESEQRRRIKESNEASKAAAKVITDSWDVDRRKHLEFERAKAVRTQEALNLAGTMYLAGQAVTLASAFNLSQRVADLQVALQNYDAKIMEMFEAEQEFKKYPQKEA